MANVSTSGDKLVSDAITDIIVLVNWVTLCGVIAVVGTVTNVVNILVFVKMGLRDTVNMTFMALAVADLCGLVLLAWIGTCYNPLLRDLDLVFDPYDIEYLTGGWPRLFFTRVTSWITAFAAFERCVCILAPFRVRQMITPRRVACVIVCIYLCMAVSVFPTFYSTGLGWIHHTGTNRTILGLVYREDRQAVDSISFVVGVLVTMGSFACVTVCSVVLVISLHRQNRWRQKAVANSASGIAEIKKDSDEPKKKRAKDKNVGKMVLIISTVFIICYLPGNIIQIAMSEFEEFNKGKLYVNMVMVSWSISNVMDATNSAVNIFIYLMMSSKFRSTFNSLFCTVRSQPDHSKN